MLFATPIVKEQVKLDPRFAGSANVNDEDLATIAMERRGLRDLELMRHVNAMLKEAGGDYFAMRLYNGSAERLWLDWNSYTGDSAIWKYPPDLFVDPGQWSVVIAKGAEDPSDSIRISKLTLAYRGAQSELTIHWFCTFKSTAVAFSSASGGTQPQPISASRGNSVATIHRGYAGSNVVVDGIYTTLKQFPRPNHIA